MSFNGGGKYTNLIPNKNLGNSILKTLRGKEKMLVNSISSSSLMFFTEEKSFRRTLWIKVKLLQISNITFFHDVFHAICILKSFNGHILVVICSVFEFGTVAKINGVLGNGLRFKICHLKMPQFRRD